MKKLASLLLVLLLGACTMAPQHPSAPAATEAAMIMAGVAHLRVLDPPPRWAAEGLALEAAGRIDYAFVSREQAARTCNGSGACTYRRIAGGCRITISTHYDPAMRAAMINHERAHCAGWPASHPPY